MFNTLQLNKNQLSVDTNVLLSPIACYSHINDQVHHEKELEHLKRMMFRKEEDLVKNQTLERKALPKRIRQEMKAREMMFRESMRISVTNLNEILKPTEEKERIKKVIKV